MPHYIGQVSEHAVIFNGNGDILILRHRGHHHPELRGKAHLPGGRLEIADMPGRALLREIEEETGITGVNLILPCSARRWGAVEPIKYSVAYLATVAGCPVAVLPPDEDHESAEWIAPDAALAAEYIFDEIRFVVADVVKWAKTLGVVK